VRKRVEELEEQARAREGRLRNAEIENDNYERQRR